MTVALSIACPGVAVLKFTRPIPAVMVFLSLAACIINLHLTAIHFEGSKSPNWFSEGCTPEDDPTYDCEQVVHTKWAGFSTKRSRPCLLVLRLGAPGGNVRVDVLYRDHGCGTCSSGVSVTNAGCGITC